MSYDFGRTLCNFDFASRFIFMVNFLLHNLICWGHQIVLMLHKKTFLRSCVFITAVIYRLSRKSEIIHNTKKYTYK